MAFKSDNASNSRHRLARLSLRQVVVLTVLVLWPVVAWAAARGLVVNAGLRNADALVVLGGSSAYVERTATAAKLFREGRAPVILLTDDGGRGGWSSSEQRNPPFVELAQAELRRAGVPQEKIMVLPERPANTYDEAALALDYATKNRFRSILVVTSGYHSRRALWTWQKVFRGSGIEMGLEPATAGNRTPSAWLWWLSAQGWREVGGEYAKMVYYFAKY